MWAFFHCSSTSTCDWIYWVEIRPNSDTKREMKQRRFHLNALNKSPIWNHEFFAWVLLFTTVTFSVLTDCVPQIRLKCICLQNWTFRGTLICCVRLCSNYMHLIVRVQCSTTQRVEWQTDRFAEPPHFSHSPTSHPISHGGIQSNMCAFSFHLIVIGSFMRVLLARVQLKMVSGRVELV